MKPLIDKVHRIPRWFIVKHVPTGRMWKISHFSAEMACHLVKVRRDECLIVEVQRAKIEGEVLNYQAPDPFIS